MSGAGDRGRVQPGNRSHAEYCAAVAAEIAGLAAVAEGADPATPVPTCPGWTVAALVKHTGLMHRWVEHMVRRRSQERVSPRDIELGLPGGEAGYPAWLAAGAEPLVGTLRAAEPDAPVWTWGPGRRADWWSRRMLYETTVHRADAELALGRGPAVEPGTALDGIDEFLANLSSHRTTADRMAGGMAAGLEAEEETVHLHATDSGGEWMIALRPDGFGWEHGHGKGTVAVRGATSDLLFLVYGRLKPADDRFTVFGDHRLLDHWREMSAF